LHFSHPPSFRKLDLSPTFITSKSYADFYSSLYGLNTLVDDTTEHTMPHQQRELALTVSETIFELSAFVI